MPDPALIGGAIAAVAIISAGAYAAFSGNSASVDVDSDGEDEVKFGTAETPEDDPREDESENQYTATEADPSTLPEDEPDVTNVKGVGETRANALSDEGIETAADLYYASDSTLTDVDGIGKYTVSQIREDIGGIDYVEDPNDESESGSDDDSSESE